MATTKITPHSGLGVEYFGRKAKESARLARYRAQTTASNHPHPGNKGWGWLEVEAAGPDPSGDNRAIRNLGGGARWLGQFRPKARKEDWD